MNPSPQPRALREAHAHIAQHGRAMGMEPMHDCADQSDCLARIARAADRLRSTPASRWLLGVGLRTEAWPDPVWPTAAQLDAVTGPRPVCIWSFDHHALVVNTAAMRAVGISSSTPDPESGRIVRDPATNAPTGVMLEAAAKMVWNAIPEPAPDELRAHILAALTDLAAHGFTEVHDLLSQPWLGPILAELDDAGRLPMPVLIYPRLEHLDQVAATAPAWQRDRVRLAGAKLFADGTLNSRTAWMLDPFADPLPGMPLGQPMLTPAQLRDAVAHVRSLGVGLAVHAIGDGAVRAVLDAYETAGRGQGLRIEHAEIIDAADVPRFAELGVVCSVQPCHLLTDIEALRRGLPHRLDRVFPLRDLIDSGCAPGELLWFGSDTPIVRPHPRDSIQAAVHRRRDGMPAAEMIAPEQAITEAQAWACFTRPVRAGGS